MDFSTLSNLSGEALTEALSLDFSTLDSDALNEHLTERQAEAKRMFAMTEVSVPDADIAEALVASIKDIESEQAEREAKAKAAAERFAAARDAFSSTDAEADESDADDDEDDESDESDESDEDDESDESDEDADADADEGDAEVQAAAKTPEEKKKEAEEKKKKEKKTSTPPPFASQRAAVPARKTSAAKRVGANSKRPAREDTSKVVITASAGVPDVPAGKVLDGMVQVAAATQGTAKTFAPWNKQNALALRSQGVKEQLVKVPVAQFAVPSTNDLSERSGTQAEYDAVGEAVKAHKERINASIDATKSGNEAALAAAMAWCSPSEVVYNWIADFVVDGLLDLPEISAPRGGLMLTEGPQLLQSDDFSGDGVDDFGFGGTEAEMEAGYVKTCETITCPDFLDHRLDFDGYCWKIPILTESTFPELIADAMKVSDVAYAHKMNRRFIRDVIAGSVAKSAGDVYGGSMLDTLEAFVQIAVKERRWWNLGENAVLEVKLPQHAREIFLFDMQRRSGLALNDVANEQKVNALFAAHRLSVKYLSDFDDRQGSVHPTADWPDTIRGIMYPAGAFVKAQFDVIRLSAVHDAASLAQNEYTGVFYEQGVKTIKRGYRSTVLTVPVCTAGATGANLFVCGEGLNGSF